MCDADNEKEKLLGDHCDDLTDELLCDRGKCARCNNHEDYNDCYKVHFSKRSFKQDIAFKSRVNSICVGASNILSENIKYAFIVSSCLVILLATVSILLLLALYLKQKHQMNAVHRRNVFCKEVTDGNFIVTKSAISQFLHASDKIFVEPKKNLFYVIDGPLTKEQACNIESVLKALPDKLIYIIEMDDDRMHRNIKLDYIAFLQKSYDNINRIKTEKKHFFEGSLFENFWNKTNEQLSLFAAKALIVWQFGGAVLSEDLVMSSRNIFDKISNKCMADKDLLYCPHECSAYMFSLMKEIVKNIKLNSSSSNEYDFDRLIDNSINDICCKNPARTGCNQVYRLQGSDLCNDKLNSVCQFIRIDKTKYRSHCETLKHFCKYISGTF